MTADNADAPPRCPSCVAGASSSPPNGQRGDKPFKCPDCGKNFGRASHLKTHRRLHTGEKPFKCTFCSKSFTQKAGLLAHIRLHTGERPYKCNQCGEAFRSMSNLLSHKAQEASGKARPASAPVSAPAPPTAGLTVVQQRVINEKPAWRLSRKKCC
uniref:C2H2-type domain-containing protein n=1 Tax=Fundulus heteroclitus TaxID=8078 RepID=A0A3Q2T1F3_FUNHE